MKNNLAAVPVERRQFGRRQTSCHGWVKVKGRPAIACVVRNISEGGALLEFQNAEMLPYRFRIVIESEGVDSDCETRHQTGNRMGVQFVKDVEQQKDGSYLSTDDVRNWMSKHR
jgi:hypothetical protein